MNLLKKFKIIIKDRIKSFFNTDIEKDLQEERPKKFEKVKLFILERNNLFIGILAFLLVVNILIWFELNAFYIRATLAFIFLITVPGLLVMLMFRIRKINFWEYLVYTVGLSVSFIMFAGLFVNWTLPFLHITDKPLSLIPILTSFNIFLLIFWFVAFYRNKDLKFEIKSPKLDWTNRIFIIVPMIFPVLSILGALILNNFGPNYLTMLMLGGIAVYVLLVVIYRDKLNENVFPWAIWMIAVSLLLMYSLRSEYIFGYDIHREFKVYQITLETGFWSFENFKSTYNSSLSISILPAAVRLITNINPYLIFKFFFPLVFSFLPLVSFLFNCRHINKIKSFLVSFIFLSIVWFIDPITTMGRQEIAFLFFGLTVFAIFTTKNQKLKNFLFVFGPSMIVAHYSTSYVAITLLVLVYSIAYLFPKNKKEVHRSIPLIFIFVLLVFSFLWYSQLTSTSEGLKEVARNSVRHLDNVLSFNMKSNLLKQVISLDSAKSSPREIEEYFFNLSNSIPPSNGYAFKDYSNFNFKLNYMPYFYPKSQLYDIFDILYKGVLFFISIFAILGAIYIIFIYRKNVIDLKYFLFTIIFGLFAVMIFLIPKLSIYYSLDRLYLQSSIFASIVLFFGGFQFFKLFLKKESKIFVFIVLIILMFFLYNYSLMWQISGGKKVLWLNNEGYFYDSLYTHAEETVSAWWLGNVRNKDSPIFADSPTAPKIRGITKIENFKTVIVPQTLERNSYVYLSVTNKKKNTGFFEYQLVPMPYVYPSDFLNNNKNKIYNNGGSEIFK